MSGKLLTMFLDLTIGWCGNDGNQLGEAFGEKKGKPVQNVQINVQTNVQTNSNVLIYPNASARRSLAVLPSVHVRRVKNGSYPWLSFET